jgi:hypothetical protein
MELLHLHLKIGKFQTWFASAISCRTHILSQSANHVDGVVVDDDQWSEIWWQMRNECWWWFARVHGGHKLVDPFDDMKKVKVGSLDDMEVERVRSSGEACFGCGRCESGVKWWGTNVETTPIKLVRGYLTPHLQNPPPIDVHLCHLALSRNPTASRFYQETPLPPPAPPLLSLMFVDQHFQESVSLLWCSLSCSF